MGQFMDDNAPKEEECGEDRERPNHSGRPLWIAEVELTCKSENDEESDDHPTVMQTDVNAEQPADANIGTHKLATFI
jgi:hypothetical protein